jgi:uncharacterized protein YxjI
LIVRGKSTGNRQRLGLSVKTVETHRSQIMKRLQIFDVAGLVLFAVREQIISLDDLTPAPNSGECSGKCTRKAAGRASKRRLSPSSGSPSRLMLSPRRP